jgi:hypothetical protein
MAFLYMEATCAYYDVITGDDGIVIHSRDRDYTRWMKRKPQQLRIYDEDRNLVDIESLVGVDLDEKQHYTHFDDFTLMVRRMTLGIDSIDQVDWKHHESWNRSSVVDRV